MQFADAAKRRAAKAQSGGASTKNSSAVLKVVNDKEPDGKDKEPDPIVVAAKRRLTNMSRKIG